MIQDRPLFQPSQDVSLLTSELRQYRKINNSLRKKIKEKDNRIQQLFGYIQDAGVCSNSPENYALLGQLPLELSLKLARSQSKRKEKQDKNPDHHEDNKQSSLIKHLQAAQLQPHPKTQPSRYLSPFPRKEEQRYIFQEASPDYSEKKTKIIKISLEKLKPLNPEEVKKRFLMKYQKAEIVE